MGPETTRGVILLYHRVADVGFDPFGLCVPPSTFAAQLQALQAEYEVVPLLDLIATNEGRLPRTRRVAISFDDGYLDNLTTASPLLAERGLPATFFLTTRHLDSDGEYWWDTLARGFAETQGKSGNLDDLFGIHQRLLVMDVAERGQELMRCLTARHMAPSTCRPLRRAEVRTLADRRGHSVGTHTTDHLNLSVLPNAVSRRQIATSVQAIEATIRRPVESIAYPFGAVSEPVISVARGLGLKAGVVASGSVVRTRDDRYRLARMPVDASDQDLIARLEQAFQGSETTAP